MRSIYNLGDVADRYRASRTDYATAHMGVVAQQLGRRLDGRKVVTVLDVGCGAGGSYRLLRESLPKAAGPLRYVGIDDSQRQIEAAHRDHAATGNARFLLGTAAALPFRDDAFEVVFECRLFQFVAEPLDVLREMIRTARDVVIATVYTHEKHLVGFHPLYESFELDENHHITSGGALLRQLNIESMPKGLMLRVGDTNRYQYAFAKQRRTLLAHAELDDFLERSALRVVNRQIETKPLDTIVAPEDAVTGLTSEKDRLAWPDVRQQTLVLAKDG